MAQQQQQPPMDLFTTKKSSAFSSKAGPSYSCFSPISMDGNPRSSTTSTLPLIEDDFSLDSTSQTIPSDKMFRPELERQHSSGDSSGWSEDSSIVSVDGELEFLADRQSFLRQAEEEKEDDDTTTTAKMVEMLDGSERWSGSDDGEDEAPSKPVLMPALIPMARSNTPSEFARRRYLLDDLSCHSNSTEGSLSNEDLLDFTTQAQRRRTRGGGSTSGHRDNDNSRGDASYSTWTTRSDMDSISLVPSLPSIVEGNSKSTAKKHLFKQGSSQSIFYPLPGDVVGGYFSMKRHHRSHHKRRVWGLSKSNKEIQDIFPSVPRRSFEAKPGALDAYLGKNGDSSKGAQQPSTLTRSVRFDDDTISSRSIDSFPPSGFVFETNELKLPQLSDKWAAAGKSETKAIDALEVCGPPSFPKRKTSGGLDTHGLISTAAEKFMSIPTSVSECDPPPISCRQMLTSMSEPGHTTNTDVNGGHTRQRAVRRLSLDATPSMPLRGPDYVTDDEAEEGFTPSPEVPHMRAARRMSADTVPKLPTRRPATTPAPSLQSRDTVPSAPMRLASEHSTQLAISGHSKEKSPPRARRSSHRDLEHLPSLVDSSGSWIANSSSSKTSNGDDDDGVDTSSVKRPGQEAKSIPPQPPRSSHGPPVLEMSWVRMTSCTNKQGPVEPNRSSSTNHKSLVVNSAPKLLSPKGAVATKLKPPKLPQLQVLTKSEGRPAVIKGVSWSDARSANPMTPEKIAQRRLPRSHSSHLMRLDDSSDGSNSTLKTTNLKLPPKSSKKDALAGSERSVHSYTVDMKRDSKWSFRKTGRLLSLHQQYSVMSDITLDPRP